FRRRCPAAGAACSWRRSTRLADPDHPTGFSARCTSSGPGRPPERRGPPRPRPRAHQSTPELGCAWLSPRGLLAEAAEQELFGERNALEFEQLDVLLHPA